MQRAREAEFIGNADGEDGEHQVPRPDNGLGSLDRGACLDLVAVNRAGFGVERPDGPGWQAGSLPGASRGIAAVMQPILVEMRDWLLAIVGALTAVFTGLFWFLTYRSSLPVIEAFVRKIDGTDVRMELRIHNRARHTIRVEEIHARRPRGMTIETMSVGAERPLDVPQTQAFHDGSLEVSPEASVSVLVCATLPEASLSRRPTALSMSVRISSSSRRIRRKRHIVTAMPMAKTM